MYHIQISKIINVISEETIIQLDIQQHHQLISYDRLLDELTKDHHVNKVIIQIKSQFNENYAHALLSVIQSLHSNVSVDIKLHTPDIVRLNLIEWIQNVTNVMTLNYIENENEVLELKFLPKRYSINDNNDFELYIQPQLSKYAQHTHESYNQLLYHYKQLLNDYQTLYGCYLKTFKDRQGFATQLIKFKKSAWKYKKIVLENEKLLKSANELKKAQSFVNNQRIKKGIKKIMKVTKYD
ncbi:hypothetical protein [Mammaliicoccus stepanovicii]|uniref:Uncharacterized protein n=1 Tax=Mammaliicoccus stepanovicii TaxID=643214 RepID=A0A239ZQM6_9STAP|nr:hypothetical protein [Mammaliicoccus stepanovicii]PNZ76933.1 hypothetical protein CD111_05485 [Mammaliicoccus stepanovicii]GGI41341.1 hypothetical protein GCM10010896_12870 [Mammaliicoccus stepanovicii]SNV73317.1 Uncharacterised protein [Mammaliicoccus stepanovicii]